MQLKILRRIDPSPELREWLSVQGQLEEIQDKGGRYHFYVNDAPSRDSVWNDEITGTAHLGWVVFDTDNNAYGFFTSLERAEAALKGAKVTINTEFDVELEEAPEEADTADLPRPRARR